MAHEPADYQTTAEDRPEVRVQRANYEVTEAGIRTAEAPLWPGISLNYSRQGIQTSGFLVPLNTWTFQSLLSYPIFGSGPTSAFYNVKAAKLTQQKVTQDLRAARDQAVSDLRADWDNLITQIDQVTVAYSLLTADRQRNDEADIEYQSGILTYNNWEIIVTQRIGDEFNALTQELQAAQAQATWNRVLGKGLTEP
jgi:outer membrane protein TolC